jgi:hypothetical protein
LGWLFLNYGWLLNNVALRLVHFCFSQKDIFFFFHSSSSRAKGLFPQSLCRLWHYALTPSLLYYDSLLIISRRRGNIFVFTVAFSISKNPSGLGNGKGLGLFTKFERNKTDIAITCSYTICGFNWLAVRATSL